MTGPEILTLTVWGLLLAAFIVESVVFFWRGRR